MSEPRVDLITLRPGVPDDKAFIMATWLRGLFYGDSWFSLIPKNIFMKAYHAILEAKLADPRTTVTVACLKDTPDVILGYSVSRGTVLDWMHVKDSWRRIGIGKSLVPQNLSAVSHLSKLGKQLKPANVPFNPFS